MLWLYGKSQFDSETWRNTWKLKKKEKCIDVLDIAGKEKSLNARSERMLTRIYSLIYSHL